MKMTVNGKFDKTLPVFSFFILLLCGVCVLCGKRAAYNDDAPVWSDSDDNNGNVLVPNVSSRAKDELNDDDRILQIFNECECVMFYLCDDDNYIISDGRGILSPRSKSSANVTRIACQKEFHYCCKLRSNDTSTTATIPINKNPNSFPTDHPLSTTTESSATTGTKCGIQRPSFNLRILSKEPSTIPGEFPWMVAIINKKSKGLRNYEFKCAGSIIHPRAILTAVHCVRRLKLNSLKVVYNITEELDLSENGPNYDKKSVSKIVLHPDFYSGGLYNDIALLILESEIELNGLVNSVCLPQQGEVFNNTNCWAAGWGDTKSAGDNGVRHLRKVKVPMVPARPCQALLKSTRLGLDFTLHESFVCAGGAKDEDTCYGDGGGPLVCSVSYEKYVQTGIVSWGVGCGEESVPGVYTNVALFSDWIQNEMRKEGLNFE